jgi:hypothetical protein
MQLVDFIAEHYMWGSKQYISLWCDLDNESIEIKSDEHLIEWFQLNLENGVVCIVAQINDFEGPLQFSLTKRRCHPSVRHRVPTMETTTNLRATTETATNVKAKSTSKKRRATYEGVGVDEEGMYSDTDSLAAPSYSSYDLNLAATSCSDDSDLEFDPDGAIIDTDDEFDPPPFSYDVDYPCIDVNVVFPDVDQCKSAVTHHAILNDHAFEIVKKIEPDLEPSARGLIRVAIGSFFCIYKQEVHWLQGKSTSCCCFYLEKSTFCCCFYLDKCCCFYLEKRHFVVVCTWKIQHFIVVCTQKIEYFVVVAG